MEKEYIAKTEDKEVKLEDKDFMLYEVIKELTKVLNNLSTQLK